MNGTPVILWPSAAGNISLRLSRQVLAGVDPLITPLESAASNLQKLTTLQHSLQAVFMT